VNPANAYGRVKRRAEEMFLRDGRATVLRVSLTYGWSDGRHRRNFAERCLLAAAHEGEFHAPIDQYFTPVYLDDVAVVVAAACLAPQMVPMVAHLAGPERLSRFAFARTAYTIAGRDPDRVRPVSRQDTVWASRPDDSSLLSTDFSAVPRLAGFAACRAAAGLAAMCRSWAGGMGTWAPVMDPASMSQSGAEASPAPQGSTGVGA